MQNSPKRRKLGIFADGDRYRAGSELSASTCKEPAVRQVNSEEVWKDRPDKGKLKKLLCGTATVEVSEMRHFQASNELEVLRKALLEDGYLLVRGLLDRKQVLNARHYILGILGDNGFLNTDHPINVCL